MHPRSDPYSQRLKSGLLGGLGHSLAYFAWFNAFQLIALSLFVYFFVTPGARFQEIGEAYGANEILVLALSALLYLVLLTRLRPLVFTTRSEIVTAHRFEKRFTPGLLRGMGLALAFTAALLVVGFYHYLGFFFVFDSIVRILTLAVLIYCEEFIFRDRILNSFRQAMPTLAAVLITSALYCLAKALQFGDLGLAHLLTLFLLSLAISVRTIVDGDFARGAGYWAGILILFHAFLGLPIFGNEAQGLLMMNWHDPNAGETARLLTGGAAGPLSSISLQLLFLGDVILGVARNRKILLH